MFEQNQRASWFSHKAEIAKPYYYKVYLADHDVTTEMTVTERASLFCFTFPEEQNSYVIVDAFDKGSYIKIIPEENKIIGYSTRNSGRSRKFQELFYHCFRQTVSIHRRGSRQCHQDQPNRNRRKPCRRYYRFLHTQRRTNTRTSSLVFHQFRAGGIEFAGTRRWRFRPFNRKGKNRWNEILSKIEIKDNDIDNLRTFYSCLYRSVLFPRAFYEINAEGETIHYSPYNGQVLPGYLFTDTGFWDTFRSLFPLLNLIYPR